MTLWMNPHDPITMIIEKIRRQRRRAYAGQQSLSFQEPGRDRQVLSPQCSLADYGIFTDVHLQLLEAFSPELQVFVRSSDGVSRAYTIHPTCYIRSLKQQIEAREGLMLAQQRLEFRGYNLQDWLTLGDCGIQDNDTLVLSRKREGELS